MTNREMKDRATVLSFLPKKVRLINSLCDVHEGKEPNKRMQTRYIWQNNINSDIIIGRFQDLMEGV